MMTIPDRLPQYKDLTHCLVVLNGPTGDQVPDMPMETFVCNGNFDRRRAEHVVTLDLKRVQYARRFTGSIWTRPRFCRRPDIPVPDNHQIFNDSGNAAVWAAHNLYDLIYIAGADSWLGGETRTVCDELYEVNPKKAKLPPIWFRKFSQWTAQTANRYVFITDQVRNDVETIAVRDFVAKYSCQCSNANKHLNADTVGVSLL